jgi:5-methylcytosine-specific restriction protein B
VVLPDLFIASSPRPDCSICSADKPYLSLLFPDILDDYHNPDYQKHHLIKILVLPAELDGMYASAGKLARVAKELGWPMNHLTTVLNSRDGEPIKYWRIGTKLDKKHNSEDIWPDMLAGGFAAIGWADLGDLSAFIKDKEAKGKIFNLLNTAYAGEYIPSLASRKAGEIKNFINEAEENHVVLAADGMKILGIGKFIGPYYFDESNPDGAPHRRRVEWHESTKWKSPVSEGLQTTFKEIGEDNATLIEVEKILLEPIMKTDTTSTGPTADDDSAVGTKL